MGCLMVMLGIHVKHISLLNCSRDKKYARVEKMYKIWVPNVAFYHDFAAWAMPICGMVMMIASNYLTWTLSQEMGIFITSKFFKF